MEPGFWLALALKMVSAASLVVAACLVVDRAGPRMGGLVASLPLSAGPAYTVMALEHGSGFIGGSAVGALASLCGTASFILAYAATAQRHGRLASVAAGLAGWLAAVTILRGADLGLWPAAAADVGFMLAVLLLVRKWRAVRLAAKAAPRWRDLMVRAAASMAVVATVVVLGRLLGPAAAGVAAVAPVITTSLAILLWPRLGGRGAAAVLSSMIPGLVGNVFALVALALTAITLGSTLALLLALAICVGWNLGLAALPRLRRA